MVETNREPAREPPDPGDAPRLRIDWIVPGMLINGGGHRNIFRAAYFLEQFGHDVRLHFVGTDLPADELHRIIREHFFPFGGSVQRYDGRFREADVILATHWTTVEAALAARPSIPEVMYFVQDFEPMFSPMGTEYILAENTYRLGLYCVCSGVWCSELLRRQYGATADAFGYPLDRANFYPRPRRKARKNVVFFARPEMPRRCYPLGLEMLRHLHRMMPDLEIVMYGSAEIDRSGLDFPVTVAGVLPTMADLAQLYSDADLGIAFATTNPSLVPYEMMACGLPVVDIGRPGTEMNYGGGFDIVLLANPIPRRMAEQVHDLLSNPDERAARSRRSLEFVSTMPSEEEMVRQIEELIVRRVMSQATMRERDAVSPVC